MSYFKSLSAQFMHYCTLLLKWRSERKHRNRLKSEQRDAQLMNSLFWPKGNTTSYNAPPPFIANSVNIELDESGSLKKTRRKP